VFHSEEELKYVMSALNNKNIFPRRYFYPSLNTLPFLVSAKQHCPISESVSPRILCLPLYFDLTEEDQKNIAQIILQSLPINVTTCV